MNENYMENNTVRIKDEEALTPDAIRALKKADVLMDKIEKGISLGKVSWFGLADEQKVRESKYRYDGVKELTDDEFVRLLQGERK